MDLSQESFYVGALYVGFGFCFGLVADFFLLAYFSKIKAKFFSQKQSAVPWGLWDVVILFLVYFGLQSFFAAFVFLSDHFHLFSERTLHYISLFWATLGVNILIALFIFSYFQKKYRLRWKDLGFYKKKIKSYLGLGGLGYLAFIPLFFLLILLSSGVCSLFGVEPQPHVLIDILKEEKSFWVLGGLALFASVVGPIIEEILFRGVLYSAVRKKWGVNKGLMVTSLFFALIHFNFFQFIPIFGLGLALTWLYEKTGNLLPSIAMHALNNTVSLALTFTLLYSSQ